MTEKKKICFVASDASGVGYYRSFLPCKYLKSEFDTSITVGFDPNKLYYYYEHNIVILQRHYHPDLLKFVDVMHEKGKQVWYDIDDLLWDIPNANSAKKAWTKNMLKDAQNLISVCDVVTVSTKPLYDYIKRFNKNVYIMPNMVEDNFIKKEKNDKVRILYFGSNTHSGDFSSAVKYGLDEIVKQDNVELIFMGYIPDEYKTVAKYVEYVDIKNYISTLQSINPDICIMPLDNNHFNCCKSNLKYLESTLAGAVSIASNIYPYSKTIEHNYNGLLCSKGQEWKKALIELVNDKNYREHMYDIASTHVQIYFTWDSGKREKVTEQYKQMISM